MKRAFTLIELLIVVAIIAILAAIAVPNFLEAQVRAKVSRTRADMRSIATAMEAYRVDNNKYMPMADKSPTDPAGMEYWNTPSFGDPLHSRVSNFLTTPVAFLTSLMEDVFIPQKNPPPFVSTRYPLNTRVGFRYTYFNYQQFYDITPSAGNAGRIEQTSGWFLYSWGPDRDPNNIAGPMFGQQSTFTRYDATNGTVSIGNIIRTAKSPEGQIPYNPVFTTAQNGPN